jgi:hypothetical protein
MGDHVTTTINRPWETSPSHDEYYHERRCHVADLLAEWGSTTNIRWPEGGRFVSIAEVAMTPAWFGQIVHVGKAGILRSIPGWKLTELFPAHRWTAFTHDVYFIEQLHGNVSKNVRPRTLYGYIVGTDYVRVVTLGCNHPNAAVSKSGRAYREFSCPDCGYAWGVDSSD